MSFNTVASQAVIEFEEKKSRFIGYIKPVTTVVEADNFIESVRKLHPDATHNVPLYRVVENGQEYLKYSDDGEPGGTAGKPMADIALIKNIYNFSLVATRYFGGVKLGAGGLIRMYAKTAKLAIDSAGIAVPDNRVKLRLYYDYSMTSKVGEILSKYGADILNEEYTDTVMVEIQVAPENEVALLDIYNIKIEKI